MASDPVLNEAVDLWARARIYFELNGAYKPLEEAYETLGISDDLDSILELESIFQKSKYKKPEWKPLI